MPKSKKPAGGRPSRNFDPRYGSKPKRRPGESSSGKPGSKSRTHRGFRTSEADAAQPKRRWTAQEKAGRDEARAIRGERRGQDDRPTYRGDRAVRRDDRPPHRRDRLRKHPRHHRSTVDTAPIALIWTKARTPSETLDLRRPLR